jgi:hypothetical protein
VSNDIKVGDVCVIVNSPDGWYFTDGEEVEITEGPWIHPLADEEESFRCRNSRHHAWVYRRNLRKKPPKADDQGEPRVEHIPADPSAWDLAQWHPNKTKENA